ncbi:ATPase family AAA domain-containing protein [Paramyrothecium foliicola]|nr:ATPase family AAA domain-containing protein [Paramyrothecium foliicola]
MASITPTQDTLETGEGHIEPDSSQLQDPSSRHHTRSPSTNSSQSQDQESQSSDSEDEIPNVSQTKIQIPIGGVNRNVLKSQGESQELEKPVQLTEPLDSTKILAKVRKCDWEGFVNHFSAEEPTYAIDTLFAGEQLGKEMIEEARKRQNSGYFKVADYGTINRVNTVRSNKTWLQRVRIQSPVLLEVFSRVTGYTWAGSSVTFLQPFQYLIHFHEALKQELAAMEAESSGDQPRPYVVSLLHLRCYIDFAEAEILSCHQLFSRGDQHISSKIRFHALWYLFKHGDLIYMPDKFLQRYLVENGSSNVVWSPKISTQSTIRQKIWRIRDVFMTNAQPESPVDPDVGRGAFQVFLYYLDYDGTAYSPVTEIFSIPFFEGEKDVRDLDFFPLRYAAKGTELLEEHSKIGSLFISRHKEWHVSYSGWSLVTHPMGWPITEDGSYSNLRQIRPQYVDGEVIVDFAEAYNHDPRRKSKFLETEMWYYPEDHSTTVVGQDLLIVWSDTERSSIVSGTHEVIVTRDSIQEAERNDYLKSDKYLDQEKDLAIIPEGDDLALLPSRLYVYSLSDSMFHAVDVRNMKSLTWSDDAFSQLQLHESHKQVVQSSVHSYLKRRPIERKIERGDSELLHTQDFIRKKGRGLLIMLHGEPGTGKTATAEAVAQKFRRPLLPLSCGSISDPSDAETELDVVFRMSTLWDCILLLDEADVFLSARSATENVTRNGLVSVFLRKLEYFNGILFLTTNRIGKIDQAISSRLHLILHYKRLKEPEIRNVFRINMDRLRLSEEQHAVASGTQPLVIVESDVLQFVADHCAKHPGGKGAWNGREIRNAFVIAIGIARDEAEQQNSANFQPQLRYSHFKQVEKLYDEYVQFRQRVLGKDDAERALLNEERDDDFDGLNEEDRKQTWSPPPVHEGSRRFQRATHASHAPFAHKAPGRPQAGDDIGFSMPTRGFEPQQLNNWGMNGRPNHGYGATPPGSSMALPQRAAYDTMQSAATINMRPMAQNATGYGQQHNPDYSPLTTNISNQGPQMDIGRISGRDLGQDQLLSDFGASEGLRLSGTDDRTTGQL